MYPGWSADQLLSADHIRTSFWCISEDPGWSTDKVWSHTDKVLSYTDKAISSGWCDTRKFYPLYILHVIFSYFRQSACIMSFIIFNYRRQDRILGVADHKFLKSLDTVHTNAAPLRCSPRTAARKLTYNISMLTPLARRLNQGFHMLWSVFSLHFHIFVKHINLKLLDSLFLQQKRSKKLHRDPYQCHFLWHFCGF